MSEAKAVVMDSVWEGGGSPYAIGSKKFGMWLFIISDALTFSAMLVAYTYVRISTSNWPTPFHFSPSIIFSSVNSPPMRRECRTELKLNTSRI